MATASNATPSGLIEVSAGTNDAVERQVSDCNVTITGYYGTVSVTINLWESMDHGGTAKGCTARLRRDSITGTILDSHVFTDVGDSTAGHQQQWSTTYSDTVPTTGHYVLTLQFTTNTGRIYSDTHSLSLSAPDLIGASGTPATATASAPAGSASGAALVVGVAAAATALALTGTVGARITGAVSTATASAPAGVAHSYQRLTGYDLDDNSSQALQVRVGLSAVLVTDVIPVAPPTHWTEAQVRARRLSLIIPDPTLDSEGRPT